MLLSQMWTKHVPFAHSWEGKNKDHAIYILFLKKRDFFMGLEIGHKDN